MKNENIFRSAEIMIPEKLDLSKWSVIACDQFTSDKKYWEKVEKIIDGEPSALDYILPEAYLGTDEENRRAMLIREKMNPIDMFSYFGLIYFDFYNHTLRQVTA